MPPTSIARCLAGSASVLVVAALGLAALAPRHEPHAQRAWELQPPAPVDDGVCAEIPRWEEVACARCHTEIAREWAGTRHALAWRDEHYQEALSEMRRPESCHGCHIPKPLHAQELGKKPAARELADAHFGIRCESCHLAPESTASAPVVLGPFGAATPAHGSRRDRSFLPEGESSLCIGCHATSIGPVIGIAKDFVETKQHEQGRSCVACHMQAVSRAIANEPVERESLGAKSAQTDAERASTAAAHASETAFPARLGRSHALQTPRDPAFLRRAFVLSARREAGGVVVAVVNDCGHRVPGLLEREIALSAELQDATGAPIVRKERKLDARSSLPVDGTLELELAADGARVRVRGTHTAPGFAVPVVFLDETLDVAR